MKKEAAGVELEVSQDTIRNIVSRIGLIARKGGSVAPMWVDHYGRLDPKKFGGHSAFIVSRQGFTEEFYHPETPLALLRLVKTEDTGERRIKYKIVKENGKLRIDKFDFSNTQLGAEQDNLLVKTGMTKEEEHKEQEAKFKEFIKKRDEIQEEMRQSGQSFVSENEALYLLDLLEEIDDL